MRDDVALRGLADWNYGWSDLARLDEKITEVWDRLKALRAERAEKRALLVATCPLELTELELRYWTKVHIVDDENSCWPWKRARRGTPGEEYGLFRLTQDPERTGKGTVGAHRVAFMLTNGGELPEIARHTCDNPPCCRPKHLLDGTHADNMADKKARGRGRTRSNQRGEANDSAVLTDAIVIEARKRSKAGETQQSIADDLGFQVAVLAYAISGKTWNHLDDVEAPHVRRKGGGTRLSDDDVQAIRKRAAAGETHKVIGLDYGMDRANVSHIVNRKTFKHVD